MDAFPPAPAPAHEVAAGIFAGIDLAGIGMIIVAEIGAIMAMDTAVMTVTINEVVEAGYVRRIKIG